MATLSLTHAGEVFTDLDVVYMPTQPDSHSGVSQGVTSGHVPVPKMTDFSS